MVFLPRANRDAKPGAKRQRVKDLVGNVLGKVLLLPSNNSSSNERLTRSDSNASDNSPANPATHEQNSSRNNLSAPPQVVITAEDDGEPQTYSVPIGKQPIGLLRLAGVDVVEFIAAIKESYFDEDGDRSLTDISMYGDTKPTRDKPIEANIGSSTEGASTAIESERDTFNTILDTASDSSGNSEIGSKGFNALCDTGATVSLISLKSLDRLHKGYTPFDRLHADQQQHMELADFKKEGSKPLGVVSLLWYLDLFPKVIFNTTFWVVPQCDSDVILGQDVKRAAFLAVAETKRQNMGRPPRKGVFNAIVGQVGHLAHKASGGKLSRYSSHFEESSLRQEIMRGVNSGVTQQK